MQTGSRHSAGGPLFWRVWPLPEPAGPFFFMCGCEGIQGRPSHWFLKAWTPKTMPGIVPDLGADSMDFIEIEGRMENEFDCELIDINRSKLVKVSSLVEIVKEYINGQPAKN
jgi:acyl carrier protein